RTTGGHVTQGVGLTFMDNLFWPRMHGPWQEGENDLPSRSRHFSREPVMAAPPAAEIIQRISLKNREYAHIEDANRGVVLMELGPRVLTLEAHQTLVKK